MFQSLLVYFSLLLIMILFALVAQNKGSYYRTSTGIIKERSFWKIYILFPIILFSIVFGMRYDVGKDHLGYLYAYTQKIDVSKGEPLFVWLTTFFQSLNLHYVYYFATIAFIQIFFFYYSFKRETYLFAFLIFFLFTNGEWLFWMNGIRQAIALCIWLFAIRFIEERRFYMYLIICIIASLFHNSAAILIIFYPILYTSKDYFKNIKIQLLLILSAFIIQQLFMILLPNLGRFIEIYKYFLGGGEAYQESYELDSLAEHYIESEGTNLVYLIKILLNVIIIIVSCKLKKFYNSKRFTIVYFFFFIGIMASYIFPIGFISITRPFRYFYIFDSIMYAYFAYYLFKNKTSKNHIRYLALIFLFISIFLLTILTATENSSIHYQFYFQ